MRLSTSALADHRREAIRPDLERRLEPLACRERPRSSAGPSGSPHEATSRHDRCGRKSNAEIGGLVEVAIEACGATGQTPLKWRCARSRQGALRARLLARLFSEVGRTIGRSTTNISPRLSARCGQISRSARSAHGPLLRRHACSRSLES